MLKNVRIWFKKIGTARFISHLDLNRCMLRAIHKAKIPLWYTQGFNPHAFITFALPLSLGIAGERESMDIRLEDTELTREELISRLNAALPDDIPVFDATEPVMKPGEIAYASFIMELETENICAEEAVSRIKGMLEQENIIVPKHTKSGIVDLDIKPFLGKTEIAPKTGIVEIQTVLPAGSNMNVNPLLICDAIKKYLKLDFYADIRRINLYNADFRIFE